MGAVAILGTGPSLAEYKGEFDRTIGVNDIWRYCEVDDLVVLNKQSSFGHDRLAVIQRSKPKVFWSQIVQWDLMPGFRKIEFYPGYPEKFCRLGPLLFERSYCSPFVAAQIAYKFYGATEIHLFGVDMTNHPLLTGTLLPRVQNHFRNLDKALKEKGSCLVIHGKGILADIL